MNNRKKHIHQLNTMIAEKEKFDVIIIGGGITGAGIAMGCARNQLKVLLMESHDFGYGTSGNSSKLVHGGLRYLQHGQWKITLQSVREREKILQELSGLVWPIDFVLPYYSFFQKLFYKLGLTIYDWFAMKKYHKKISKEKILSYFPLMEDKLKNQNRQHPLQGGFLYQDAQTDDVRLLIRTLKEAEKKGAIILNYFPVKDLIINHSFVEGVIAYDRMEQKEYEIYAKIVINATGFRADILRQKLGLKKIIRPLRGSHLVFESSRLPVRHALGFKHPKDQRNIFVLPWLGKTIVGTTDLDHHEQQEKSNISISQITEEEIEYLIEGIRYQFPKANITKKDIYSTWSGVRPVISKNFKNNPSKESRDMYLEYYNQLLTITGGKLTTFRIEVKKVLQFLKRIFPITTMDLQFRNPSFKEIDSYLKEKNISIKELKKIRGIRRIISYYGEDSKHLIGQIIQNPAVFSEIPFYHNQRSKYVLPIYKEEILYSIKNEWVEYPDDIIYHRFRFGIIKKEKMKQLKVIFESN